MAKRRNIITKTGQVSVLAVTAALAGCSGTSSNDAASIQECESSEKEEDEDDDDDNVNWRDPQNLIKTVSASPDARINKIEFYENGAVKIHQDSGPECYDAMVLKHQSTKISTSNGVSEDPSTGLVVWYFIDNMPTDEGNFLIAHMKGIIQSYCNYPNTQFEIQEVSSDGSCENPNVAMEFEAPDSYMPSGN